MAKVKHAVPQQKRGSKWPMVLGVVILGGGLAAGYLVFQWNKDRRAVRAAEVERMAVEARALEHAKQWDKALAAFADIEKLDPRSVHYEEALSRIEDVRTAFVRAELQAAQSAYAMKDWAAAETVANRILQHAGNNAQAKALLNEIRAGRQQEEVSANLSQAEAAAGRQQWDEAFALLDKLIAKYPQRVEAQTVLEKLKVAKGEAEKHLVRARELAGQAKKRDIGVFDSTVFALANEAKTLAPNDPEVAAVFDKISAYPRTLKVPAEVATLNEAIALARDNDRIVVGAGMYNESLIINKVIEVVGDGKVVVETAGEASPALTLGPSAQNTKISGITFRHRSMDTAAERFPAVLVRGAAVALRDCVFSHASGHGVMVMDQGRVGFAQCRFEANGWDGLSVKGEGSAVNVKNSVAVRNGEHGIDVWDGAAAALTENVCSNNQRNGITIVSAAAPVTLASNQLEGNREYGMVLVSAGGGTASGNQAKANLLGGIVVRAAASLVTVQGNKATANQGPGLSLETGLDEARYKANEATTNRGKLQIAGGLEFTE